MKFIKSLGGYFLSAMLVIGLWGYFIESLGIMGSFIAALLLVGPCWYLNHYKNFLSHKENDIFVDMALAIAVAAMVKSALSTEKISIELLLESFPTFYYLGIGAILGVLFSNYLRKM